MCTMAEEKSRTLEPEGLQYLRSAALGVGFTDGRPERPRVDFSDPVDSWLTIAEWEVKLAYWRLSKDADCSIPTTDARCWLMDAETHLRYAKDEHRAAKRAWAQGTGDDMNAKDTKQQGAASSYRDGQDTTPPATKKAKTSGKTESQEAVTDSPPPHLDSPGIPSQMTPSEDTPTPSDEDPVPL